jgi:hypothetical protein
MFEPVEPIDVSGTVAAWRDEARDIAIRVLAERPGGPGWSGATLEMRIHDAPLWIYASWPTPLGEYSVNVSVVQKNICLRIEQKALEELLTDAIRVFCAWSYKFDFSPRPFKFNIDFSRTSWEAIQ